MCMRTEACLRVRACVHAWVWCIRAHVCRSVCGHGPVHVGTMHTGLAWVCMDLGAAYVHVFVFASACLCVLTCVYMHVYTCANCAHYFLL